MCEGRRVSLIYRLGNVSDSSRKVIKLDAIDMSGKQLCKYFYDVREGGNPDDVIGRAQSRIGLTANRLPFKNPQHFAMWCKTGSYQLHC